MRNALLLLIFISSIYADGKMQMYKSYKAQNYTNACNIGMRYFDKYKNDEEYISLYGFACLYSDNIDRIATPLIKLKFTKEARLNAAYFSIILMQKKLLYHALVDGYNLSQYNFPTTNHILSKIFDLYTKQRYNQNKEFYIFNDENDKNLSYKLYLDKTHTLSKIVIEEIYNSKVVKKHMYW